MFDPKVGDLVCLRFNTAIRIHQDKMLGLFSPKRGYARYNDIFVVTHIVGEFGQTMHVCGDTLSGWTDAYDWKKL